MSALDVAIGYAGRGRPVFPVKANKRPFTAHGNLEATTDVSAVRQWWTCWPEAGVASPTGNGWLVMDVDDQPALDALVAEHEPLPPTVEAVTPRGGRHFYFHVEGEVRNSAGRLGTGLDIRGDGGYVLLPGSAGYEWRTAPDEAPVAPAPAWLLALLGPNAGTCMPVRASEWIGMLRDGIVDGERNASLARLTGHLLRRWLDVDLTAELVHLVNQHRCRPPLPPGEVEQVIDSIARTELRRRQRSGS